MADFYQQRAAFAGVNLGNTLIQASGSVGGHRSVFVKLQSSNKGQQTFPTVGGVLTNPFKGRAKIYAGDLFEYNPGITGDTGATVKLLKTYEVAGDASATEILLVRDGYHHVPFVGDTLMVAPANLTTKGTALTVTAVEATTDVTVGDIWKLTVSASASVKKGDVLVECDSDGAAVVTNPNAVALCDYDCIYEPATSTTEYEGARYLITPGLGSECGYMYISKMSPMPAAILALNTSKVEGWFHL